MKPIPLLDSNAAVPFIALGCLIMAAVSFARSYAESKQNLQPLLCPSTAESVVTRPASFGFFDLSVPRETCYGPLIVIPDSWPGANLEFYGVLGDDDECSAYVSVFEEGSAFPGQPALLTKKNFIHVASHRFRLGISNGRGVRAIRISQIGQP